MRSLTRFGNEDFAPAFSHAQPFQEGPQDSMVPVGRHILTGHRRDLGKAKRGFPALGLSTVKYLKFGESVKRATTMPFSNFEPLM